MIRLQALEARRQARLPDHRGQRGEDEAPLRQPLRHRPVHDRRDHPRDERPSRRPPLRRLRLWLGRPRRRDARQRHGRARDRHARSIRCGRSRRSWTASRCCPRDKAAEVGDIFCTATGDKHVLARRHFERMKDGAILANTGHFNVEIEIPALGARDRDARGPPVRRGVPARGRPAHLLSPTGASSTSARPRDTRHR